MFNPHKKPLILGLVLILLLLTPMIVYAAVGDISVVSISTGGTHGNGSSHMIDLSADGRYIAFKSEATNLVAGDDTGYIDIFHHDTQTGITTRVSVTDAGDGTPADDDCDNPAISGNGRYVVFDSDAENLEDDDIWSRIDVFRHDTVTGDTILVSRNSTQNLGSASSRNPDISSDGRYIVFESYANNMDASDTDLDWDIFVRDEQSNTTSMVSVSSSPGSVPGNDHSINASISADGRYVTFESDASNLVADDTLGKKDIFRHDRNTGTTIRVSVKSNGDEADNHSYNAEISPDGRYVVFNSTATNLVAGDTNGVMDVFMHDTVTGVTTRVSVDSGGTQVTSASADPAISQDGIYVVFESQSDDLVVEDSNYATDTFVKNMQTGTIRLISKAEDGTQVSTGKSAANAAISDDGYYVGFRSNATTLVPEDTDSYYDLYLTVVMSPETIGMYSRNQKTWYLKDANDDGWGNVSTVRFGSVDSSWIPAEGDWNGYGTDTIGMYSRGQKTWYLKDANNDGWGNVTTVRFGSTDSSWIPVVGDWNGNGTDTIGMYSRTQKTWYLKDANTDGWGDVTTVRFGSVDSSWIPVVGDWNGDGTDTIGMYSRTQKTWYLKDANNDGWGGVSTVRFGSVDSSWIPVVGDWNDNGTDIIGMYSRTQKTWYLKDANDDGWSNVQTIRFGSTDTSWLPVIGKW